MPRIQLNGVINMDEHFPTKPFDDVACASFLRVFQLNEFIPRPYWCGNTCAPRAKRRRHFLHDTQPPPSGSTSAPGAPGSRITLVLATYPRSSRSRAIFATLHNLYASLAVEILHPMSPHNASCAAKPSLGHPPSAPTTSSALSESKPSWRIKYAATMAAERDAPAWQCTPTTCVGLDESASRMNAVASGTAPRKSASSASSRAMTKVWASSTYPYATCDGPRAVRLVSDASVASLELLSLRRG